MPCSLRRGSGIRGLFGDFSKCRSDLLGVPFSFDADGSLVFGFAQNPEKRAEIIALDAWRSAAGFLGDLHMHVWMKDLRVIDMMEC